MKLNYNEPSQFAFIFIEKKLIKRYTLWCLFYKFNIFTLFQKRHLIFYKKIKNILYVLFIILLFIWYKKEIERA